MEAFMIKLVTLEFSKLKRSKILYIVIITNFLFFLCAAAQGLKSNYTAERLMNETLTYGTFLIIPALFSLLGSYMISREHHDDTLKSLMMIPINTNNLIAAKLIASLIIGILLCMFLFAFTLITEVVVHPSEITAMLIFIQLKNYILQGIGCFIAVLPIISLMTTIKNGNWLSVIFAELYSFTGLIASSSKYRYIYPISAVFGFSGASKAEITEYIVCCVSLLASVLITWIILKLTQKFILERDA